MRKIELSAQAQKRLHEITDYYLFHESPERTLKVLDSFDNSFLKIAENPFAYKKFLSTEFVNLDIRIYAHFNTYHIYFVVYSNMISIAEIFHLKQDPDKRKLDI
jgi:plasmid stabilization system protein ParE